MLGEATVASTNLPRRQLAALALALGAAAPAAAQRLPDGPVTIVVPYTPGTGPDILARLVAPVLQPAFGQPVVVENRVGASGNIGTQAVARAAPDGRTLMLQVNTFVMNPSLFRQVPYDPVASFTPIAPLTEGALVLAVHPGLAARDAAGFAALAAATPGRLDYASPGVGTPQHLAMALFALTAGITLNHVPYRGSAPAVQDLLAGRVAAMVLPVHTALPLAQDGRVRLLATAGAARSAAAPELPTLAEAGFPGTQADLWYGLLGPAGLSEDFVQHTHAALAAWLAAPATAAALRAQGMTPWPGPPAQLAASIARDLERWAQVIRDARISAD
jgi:tripartite-type tricarboxylate transporter receptor subunit TctC